MNKCVGIESQEIPLSGLLADGVDLSLKELKQRLADESSHVALYCYVIRSLAEKDGRLLQMGSGPNIEGGRVTLCTCKRQMRCSPWFKKGESIVWVAGFSGVSALKGKRGNWLWYLMKAEWFDSHADLYRHLPERALRKKRAHHNRLGDVFEPKTITLYGKDRFKPERYRCPKKAHSHYGKEWRRDIAYRIWGRHPVLLLGDPRMSFLWPTPRLRLRGSDQGNHLSRNYEKCISVHTLLKELEAV